MLNNQSLIKIILLFGFVIGFVLGYSPYPSLDSFWHIKTGEYIYLYKQIPTHDIFSWYGIENQLRWINHEWLYDLLIFLVYKFGGFTGVAVFTSLFSGLLFFLIYRYTFIRSKNVPLSFVIGFISMLGINSFISARPQVLSYCLLLFLAICLENKKWLWAIPVTIIGVNLHGGFYPMYLLITGFYAWREKTLLIPATFIAVLINPYFAEMITYPFKIQSYEYFFIYIDEWYRTQLAAEGFRFHFAIYLALLITLFGRKIKREDALLSLFIVVETFMAVRHLVFLYILLLPILSPYLSEKCFEILRAVNSRFQIRISFITKLRYTSLVLVGVLLIVAFHNLGKVLDDKIEDRHPVNAVSYIKQHNLQNLMNVYGDGGYLIFNGIKPLIDGRADIFVPLYNDSTLFLDYCNTYSLNADYIEFLNKYRVQHLLLRKESMFYQAIKYTPSFKQIYADSKYVILTYHKS